MVSWLAGWLAGLASKGQRGHSEGAGGRGGAERKQALPNGLAEPCSWPCRSSERNYSIAGMALEQLSDDDGESEEEEGERGCCRAAGCLGDGWRCRRW
jgi:hypothetical protein